MVQMSEALSLLDASHYCPGANRGSLSEKEKVTIMVEFQKCNTGDFRSGEYPVAWNAAGMKMKMNSFTMQTRLRYFS